MAKKIAVCSELGRSNIVWKKTRFRVISEWFLSIVGQKWKWTWEWSELYWEAKWRPKRPQVSYSTDQVRNGKATALPRGPAQTVAEPEECDPIAAQPNAVRAASVRSTAGTRPSPFPIDRLDQSTHNARYRLPPKPAKISFSSIKCDWNPHYSRDRLKCARPIRKLFPSESSKRRNEIIPWTRRRKKRVLRWQWFRGILFLFGSANKELEREGVTGLEKKNKMEIEADRERERERKGMNEALDWMKQKSNGHQGLRCEFPANSSVT